MKHSNEKTAAIILGTRPEAVKMAPVILQLRADKSLRSLVVLTGQHGRLTEDVLRFFGIRPDHVLPSGIRNRDLHGLTASLLPGLRDILRKERPDVVLVQGDTTSAFAGSLAAYYEKIPVCHVEAGLRTWDKYAPWPEEINRRMISAIADLHFAATGTGKRNLIAEKIAGRMIRVTGNPGIDALLTVRGKLRHEAAFRKDVEKSLGKKLTGRRFARLESSRMILVTGHRRENFGAGLRNLCLGLIDLAGSYPDVLIVYPVHPNPDVRGPVSRLLRGKKNIALCGPLDYPEFVYLMMHTTLIVTDSGGIQEEAPCLGKPVLVLRETTERPEAVRAGTAILTGADRERIVSACRKLLNDPVTYRKMARVCCPYGDGRAAGRIVKGVKKMIGAL